MENKHTPGPWQSGGCVVWQTDGDQIADLSLARRKPDETEANANLIAAAPKLLKALSAIIDYGFPSYMGTDLWVEETDALYEAAEEAIAEATGGLQNESDNPES